MWFIVQTWLFLKATKFVKNGNNLKMRRFDEKKTQYFFKKSCNIEILDVEFD